MVPALICHHKRGKIECLVTGHIFHRSLYFPLRPAAQGPDTLLLPCVGTVKDNQVLQHIFPLSQRDIVKGTGKKINQITWLDT